MIKTIPAIIQLGRLIVNVPTNLKESVSNNVSGVLFTHEKERSTFYLPVDDVLSVEPVNSNLIRMTFSFLSNIDFKNHRCSDYDLNLMHLGDDKSINAGVVFHRLQRVDVSGSVRFFNGRRWINQELI